MWSEDRNNKNVIFLNLSYVIQYDATDKKNSLNIEKFIKEGNSMESYK